MSVSGFTLLSLLGLRFVLSEELVGNSFGSAVIDCLELYSMSRQVSFLFNLLCELDEICGTFS